MVSIKSCLFCEKELFGRSDKKFCDAHCKSAHQYRKTKLSEPTFYRRVEKQLKLNRSILKNFNKAGKATLRKAKLHDLGFHPKFFTHYWKNSKGDTYLFVYEYGFLRRKEQNIDKYILIKWQDYMNPDIS